MIRFLLLFVALCLLTGCGANSPNGGGNQLKAAGTLTNPDAATSRFTIDPLTSWQGFTPINNKVDVATTANTQFKDESGNAMTSQAFYSFVTANAGIRVLHVSVDGTGDANLITADKVQLVP